MLLLLAGLWLSATRVSATPEVSQPVPGSPVFASFAASFDGTSTTDFVANATSPDGSPLAYVWTLQNLSCGSLVQPQQRTNTNGYFHGATQQFPQGCPFAVETQTRVTVLVARAADLDPSGTPRDGAPYFTYSQVARAHDASTTASIDPAPALHYFGVASAATSPSSSPVTPSPTSTAEPVAPPTTPTSSGLPVAGIVIGVVVVIAGGVLGWYVLRRRGDGQVDLVHPFVEVDLVHPFVEGPSVPPPDIPPPVLPPAETFPPSVPHPTVDDTGTGQEDRSGTGPEDGGPDDGERPPPPLIFGPRIIDLPLGEPPATPGDPGITPPPLPPAETFTPPAPVTPPPSMPPPGGTTPPVVPPVTPPVQPVARPQLAKHCAPQVDDIFADALDRVLSRLRTLFGTSPAMADGLLFLARNGGGLDFWVLNPITTCPGPHCPSTMTLCGRCYPPHLLSDIMYGFVGGYFDLESAIAAGGFAYQLEKWAAAKLYGDKPKQVISPQHLTEAQPAYQVGVRLGQACRDPQHGGKWHITKDDVCAELNTMNMQTALLKVLLQDTTHTDCPPATCVNTAGNPDWSRQPWSWPEPLEEINRWAVTGKF